MEKIKREKKENPKVLVFKLGYIVTIKLTKILVILFIVIILLLVRGQDICQDSENKEINRKKFHLRKCKLLDFLYYSQLKNMFLNIFFSNIFSLTTSLNILTST